MTSAAATVRYLRERHPEIMQEIITRLAALSVSVERDPATELLVLEQELSVSFILARCLRTERTAVRWLLRFEESQRPTLRLRFGWAPWRGHQALRNEKVVVVHDLML
jgi:hypothetical protein